MNKKFNKSNKIKTSKKLRNIKGQNILEPCEIPDFVNMKKLKKYVKRDLNSNKEYYDDIGSTYKISNPKKAEWILSKAIKNCVLVGDGSTNIDININDKIGIDVSVLTLRNNYTNEKSIMQNFSNCNNLDTLFNNNNGEKAVNIFRNKCKEKYNVKDEKDIYYMIFICNNKNIYMSCLKINKDNISNMKFSEFTEKCKSIVIGNFIDDKIGNVKLYKSKKRLELRLCKNIIFDKCSVKLF